MFKRLNQIISKTITNPVTPKATPKAESLGFSDMGLHPALMKAVAKAGYESPTPIQRQAFPVIAAGHDLIGCAQTGTGKTAAFALPVLQRLLTTPLAPVKPAAPTVLVLAPTRELALQVKESFDLYGSETPHRVAVIFGGVSQVHQVEALRRRPRVLVATTGRLLDLVRQRVVDLRAVDTLILDEADRLLDMGFLPDVKAIVREVPTKRQTLLFSATMPKEIRELATKILSNPLHIAVDPVSSAAANIEHRLYMVSRADKRDLLAHLLEDRDCVKVLVFSRTKHGADKIARHLIKNGSRVGVIHANKSQNARQKALSDFKDGKIHVLVASDIAARGIDVDSITHVVNFDLPEVPETFVHRIGRTARAAATGIAISFCEASERGLLKAIEKHLGGRLPTKDDHPWRDAAEREVPVPRQQQGGRQNRQNQQGRQNNQNRPPRHRR